VLIVLQRVFETHPWKSLKRLRLIVFLLINKSIFPVTKQIKKAGCRQWSSACISKTMHGNSSGVLDDFSGVLVLIRNECKRMWQII
jgi:hypothetical protein